jgi:hypothetical protein
VDRDIWRESDSTSAAIAPIPKGKSTFAFTVEFAALNKPKIAASDRGAIGQNLAKLGFVARPVI